MATVYTYLPGFKTGAGLGYPVVMRTGGLNLNDYRIQVEVKDDDEIAIGDLIMVDANNLADATAATGGEAVAIVEGSIRNKAVLEGHGLVPSKTVQFKDGDKIDVILLTAPMVLSMKCEGAVDMNVGSPVMSVAAGLVEYAAGITLTEATPNTLVATSDPRAIVGRTLTDVSTQNGDNGYLAVKVSK